MGFVDIISMVGIDLILIIVIGNGINNIKMLKCRVINNNNFFKDSKYNV